MPNSAWSRAGRHPRHSACRSRWHTFPLTTPRSVPWSTLRSARPGPTPRSFRYRFTSALLNLRREPNVEIRDDLRYTPDHEWLRVESGEAVIGITAYAADQLGDVVFVELPAT